MSTDTQHVGQVGSAEVEAARLSLARMEVSPEQLVADLRQRSPAPDVR
ncbi:hypothetical protein FHX42_001337 [Saccharopolyspora lacisalsi]|uniref:Uncharacterized protein n=1 Tax=Halosaccharopolyspora lacisalsi TaxID=1000566 RepID=A0A839DZ29_9PSEU|nr:hypothetical protein [Halosaccharopolyspora lacisalsi]MBA8824008.1 hypothetical protein [Halosaccharopolyspora lacisalsi]